MTHPVPVNNNPIAYITLQTTSSIILKQKRYYLLPKSNLSYSDDRADMERRVLLDFLLEKHLLHTRRSFDDAVFGLDTEPYSGT